MARKAGKATPANKQHHTDRAAEDHGAMGAHNGRLTAIMSAKANLHKIKLACGYLKRKKEWEIEDLNAFVRRVFDAVGA